MKNPVKHSSGENRISHHLSPLGYLLVGRKDDGGGLVGVADKGEEPVGLSSRDGRVSDLVYDDQLSLFQVLQPEAGSTLGIGGIHDPDQVSHLFEADSVSGLDCIQTQTDRDHRLAKTWRAGKYDVPTRVQSVELPHLGDLAFGDAAFQFLWEEFFQRLRIRWEVRRGVVSFSTPLIAPFHFRLEQFQKEFPVRQLGCLRTLQDIQNAR